jgi:hypothetical protein
MHLFQEMLVEGGESFIPPLLQLEEVLTEFEQFLKGLFEALREPILLYVLLDGEASPVYQKLLVVAQE